MSFLRPVTGRLSGRSRERLSCLRARPCILEILEERLLLSYSFVDLGNLGGGESLAYALNDSGQVVGHSTTIDRRTRAFLYDGGTLSELNIPPQFSSDAFGINNSGQVVGGIASAGTFHAFVYDAGALTDLGTLGGPNSAATAINDSGEIVGRSTPTSVPYIEHAFKYSNGQMTDLGTLGGTNSAAYAINGSGWITGESRRADGILDAFLYHDGTMMDLGNFGGGFSFGTALNAFGQVGGGSATADGFLHAFLLDDGVMADLGTLGGRNSEAWGINDLGQVVGDADTPDGSRAFVYADGAMTDLNSLIPPDTGLYLYQAKAINNAGQITGFGLDSGGHFHAFLLTPEEGAAPRSIAAFSPAHASSVALRWMVSANGGDKENSVAWLTATSAVNRRPQQLIQDTWQLGVPTSCDSKASGEELTVVDHVFARWQRSPEVVAPDPNCFAV